MPRTSRGISTAGASNGNKKKCRMHALYKWGVAGSGQDDRPLTDEAHDLVTVQCTTFPIGQWVYGPGCHFVSHPSSLVPSHHFTH